MSEAEQTVAQGHAPEFAVVGEPASEPHQAVVMGEPQEDAAPVLGEPVPLANGLQGDPARPPPGSEEPAINGFQEVRHLRYHQAEASVHDQEEVVDPPQVSEESLASSESLADVNTSRFESPAEERPNPSDAPAEETSSPLDALVEETPTALDAPAEETSCAPDAPAKDNLSAAEEPGAAVPPADSAEAAHAADSAAESLDPVEVSPEIPTENPCLPLEEASAAQKEAPSETLTVDPAAEGMSLIEAPLASAAPDEEALPTQAVLSREVLGSSHATCQEGIPVKESSATPATQEEPLTEEPTSSQIVPEGASLTGSKLSEAAQEEAALAAEAVQVYQKDAPLQEAVASDIVPSEPIDEEAKETKLAEEVPSVQGTEHIESLGDESHAREPDKSPFDGSSIEVAHVASEEVSQAEGSTNENLIPGTDTPREDATLLDSHHVQNQTESSVEAIVMNSFETPIPSQATRETPVEVYNPGQSLTKEALAEEFTLKETPPAMSESSQDHEPEVNGENGFQSVEEAIHVVEREQEFSMDDENAEGKEKPSSRIKLPLIFTGLAIAAVGVAVASISRTH